MFLFSGVVFGFLCSDFTNNLVRESLGVHEIGLVMSVFGLGDGLACLLFGRLSDYVGRPPIIFYGEVFFVYSFLLFLFFFFSSFSSRVFLQSTPRLTFSFSLFFFINRHYRPQHHLLFSSHLERLLQRSHDSLHRCMVLRHCRRCMVHTNIRNHR